MPCDLLDLYGIDLYGVELDPGRAAREALEAVALIQDLQLAGDEQLARRTADKQRLLPHVVAQADQLTNRPAKDDRRVEAVEVVYDVWSTTPEKGQDDLCIAPGRLQAVCATQRAVVVDLAVDGADQVTVIMRLAAGRPVPVDSEAREAQRHVARNPPALIVRTAVP